METTPKLYTLEEAYQEISKIKKDMGFSQYLENEIKEAERRGFDRDVEMLKEGLLKKSERLLNLN